MRDDASSSDEQFIAATKVKRAELQAAISGEVPNDEILEKWVDYPFYFFSPRERAALGEPRERLEKFLKRPCRNSRHRACPDCGGKEIYTGMEEDMTWCLNEKCEIEETEAIHWAPTDKSCGDFFRWTSP